MTSKAKSDVKALKGQDGTHFTLVYNGRSYVPSRPKAENKVLDYIKRVRSSAVKCSSSRILFLILVTIR